MRKKEGYSIIKISYNLKDLEELHPDVREGIDYSLVAAQGGGLSRYLGGFKSDKKDFAFYLVFEPYKFLKALIRIMETYNVEIILEEEFSKN